MPWQGFLINPYWAFRATAPPQMSYCSPLAYVLSEVNRCGSFVKTRHQGPWREENVPVDQGE